MSSGELARLIAARDSLRTALKSVFVLADQVEARVAAGATLEEVQGQIDLVRSEFDAIYAQLESIRTQAQALEPRPDAFLAELDKSLDVNRPNNYQILAQTSTKAGQNTNKRNAEIANKAASDQGPKTDSAGDITAEATQARDDRATPQNPPLPPGQIQPTGTVEPAGNVQPTTAEEFSAPGSARVAAAPPRLPGPVATTQPSTSVAGTLPSQPREATPDPQARYSYVYKAVTVTSVFDRGQFFQDLEGVLLIFNDPPNSAGDYDNADGSLAAEGRPATGNTTAAPPRLTGSTPASTQSPSATQPAGTGSSSSSAPANATPTTGVIAPAVSQPATSGTQSVSPVAAQGEGRAMATVGAFTVTASIGPGENGTAWVISIGGIKDYAFNVNDLVSAAQRVQQRALRGVVEDVQDWVASGQAQQLEQAVLTQAGAGTPTVAGTTQNIARET